MSKKVKIFAIVTVSLAILIWILSSIGGGSSEPKTETSALSSSIASGTVLVVPQGSQLTDASNTNFSSILSNVKSIVIDDSIFSNSAYKALRDHPITLGTDIIGRNNPFAPVGTDGADVSTSPTVQTLQPGKITSKSAEFSARVSFTTTAPVSVVFQYGPTDQFGSVTAPQTMTKSGTAVSTITTLSPNTTYYVQAVAVVGSTTTNGNVMTFVTTTPPGL
jgi:hypothetical protein